MQGGKVQGNQRDKCCYTWPENTTNTRGKVISGTNAAILGQRIQQTQEGERREEVGRWWEGTGERELLLVGGGGKSIRVLRGAKEVKVTKLLSS